MSNAGMLRRFARYVAYVEDGDYENAEKQLNQNDYDYVSDIRAAMRVERESEVGDNDPVCVCGVYKSEHAMMGCPEGFQTPSQWEGERHFIYSLSDDEFEDIYG